MPSHSLPQFHGIIPPVVTPLLDGERLDLAGLDRLIEHLMEGGVHGLFMLGTTGEAPSLDEQIQRELITHTCQVIKSRVPVLMGISSTSLRKSRQAAKLAADAGCTAVVAAAPYYMPLDQSELVGYIQQLVKELSLPLVLYNFPLLAKVSFEPETVARLLDEAQIVGIKDSSGDLSYFARLVEIAKKRTDVSLLAGKEANLAKVISLGGHGGVPGGANIWPRLLVNLYDAARNNDESRIEKLTPKLMELGKIYAVPGDRFSATIAGIKTALELKGVCGGTLAQPIQSVTSDQKAEIMKILQSLELI